MTGKIVKGIAGFYYVHVPGSGIYECKAKGIFRNRNQKPLVGDMVIIEPEDDELKIGNVTEILPRKNQLTRPLVANVDQALVVFAAADPDPNLHLLDYFLIRMQFENVPVIICFNKSDLVDLNIINDYMRIYHNSGFRILSVSAGENEGIDELHNTLISRTTVLAGPSGVGKSSIMNILFPEAEAETGEISRKLGRGKHTTRHSEIFCIGSDSYLMDTPGFSSLSLPQMEKNELGEYFQEFDMYRDQCRFLGCLHHNEPDCMVKKAVTEGLIPIERYESYLLMLDEIQKQKKW